MKSNGLLPAAVLLAALARQAPADVRWTNANDNQDWWDGGNWADTVTGLPPGDHPPRYVNYIFDDPSLPMPSWSSGGSGDPGGGVVYELRATRPGSYPITHKLNYLERMVAVAGATLVSKKYPNSKQFRGDGTCVVDLPGQIAMSADIAGGTVDFRNTADTWLSGSYGGDWGNTLSGSGTVLCTQGFVTFSQLYPHFAFSGTIDATMKLYNAGTYNFANCVIQKTIGTNLLQNAHLTSGRYAMKVCDIGTLAASTATVQNATFRLNGQVLARRPSHIQSTRYDTEADNLATLGFDNCTLQFTNLTVMGNIAFTGAPSRLQVDVLSAGGVAGADYTRLAAIRYADDGGAGNVGGMISGLDNVETAIRVAPGLNLDGATLVIVTNAAPLAGTSFRSVAWEGGSGQVHYNADGSVTLTGVKASGQPGTAILVR
jgi:hypothetical protein